MSDHKIIEIEGQGASTMSLVDAMTAGGAFTDYFTELVIWDDYDEEFVWVEMPNNINVGVTRYANSGVVE